MPEPMKKLTVITLRDFEEETLEGLGGLGVLHLKKVEGLEFLGLKPEAMRKKREYEDLYSKFNLLRKRLGVWELPEAEGPAKIPEAELRRYIEGCERRLDELLSKINDAKENLRQLEERKKKLEILRDNGVEVGELGRSQDRFVRAGLISKDLAPKLDKYFSSLKYLTYKTSPVSPLDSFILVIGMEEAEEWILSILSLFKFREFVFPPSVPKETEKALIEVDGELKNAEERITKIEDQREELKRSFMEKMSAIGPHLRDYIRLTEAQSLILRSESVSVLQGWIPAAEAPAVKRLLSDLKAETKGCITFTLEDPLPDEKPPTLVKTPRIIKPFSILTRMLGIPDYKEIDPTVISTILWIVMFGIMFPDVGQGLLISAIGATLAFVVKKRFFGLNLKTIGNLWIGLGISAAVFGALFGEFFLIEVQPLWLRPIENVWLMLKTVILFGVAQIFLGLTFGLINNLKKGDKIEALMGEHSVASLVLFSGLLTLIARFWISRDLSCFLHWTIFIPLIGVAMILTKSSAKKMAGREDEEGIMESIGSTIDMFISFLCNTASYARLAGFCLAHAALAEVCQVLLVKSTVLGIAGLVLMNSLALTIELMVVMIQALRLLYYEFSTKFYSGTGIRYSPLILERESLNLSADKKG